MGPVDKPVDQELTMLLYSGTLVTLLLALALVAFFLIYQKKLIRQQLALQTMQAAYQKEVFAAAIQAEERERARIGSDLHDSIGSSLAAAKMLAAQVASFASVSEREREVITIIQGILDELMQDIRGISRNLHPAVLTRLGLAQALQNLGLLCADGFVQGIAVRVEMQSALPHEHDLALYRIVQELLGNSLKHAQASRATVELLEMPTALVLTVTDDGTGFDFEHVRRSSGGLGLKSLAARVSLLDASLQVASAPGQGTRVRVAVPLPSR